MALFGNLGSFFVQLGVNGLDVVNKAFDQIHQGMEKLAKETKWTGVGMAEVFKGAAQSASGLGAALAPVTGHLQGMVMAGINASHFGQILGYQFAELNRQMASIFVPTVQTVSARLNDLIRWFRGLSGEQQATLRQWGLWIAGIGLAATAMPRIIASVQALGVALKGLSLVLTGLSVSNPWLLLVGGIGAVVASTLTMDEAMKLAVGTGRLVRDVFLPIVDLFVRLGEAIRGVAEALAGLFRNRQSGAGGKAGEAGKDEAEDEEERMRKRGMKKVSSWWNEPAEFSWKNFISSFHSARWLGQKTGIISTGRVYESMGPDDRRRDLLPPLGGFEAPEQTYRRIAQASIRIGAVAGKTPAEETAETIKKIERDGVKVLPGGEAISVNLFR
jgi:hypothetical protein